MSAVGSILTNTGALSALNSLSSTTNQTSTLENELSSGLSITSPADDPAGYITAQGFTSQINGITQAVSNANQGVSLLQTAQGAITQQESVVQKLNSIAVEAANGTETSSENQSLQSVVNQLVGQVSTIAGQTQFNNISLLNGSFSGVQFQVGANEGQTMELSIGSTMASAIGMNKSTALTSGSKKIYNNNSSGAISATGAFTAGTVSISGPQGGTSSIAVTASESAASVAASINGVSGTTGVAAQATNTTTFKLGNATAGSGFQFTLSASDGTNNIGSAINVNAASGNQIVSQINGHTATTGITASLGKSGSLVLTQANGQNMNISSVTAGELSNGAAATGVGVTTGTLTNATSATVQGQVQFQSDGAFTVGNASDLGLSSNSTLDSLSDINVTTTSGANDAINVIKYALQGLGSTGGNLGAVQQSMEANINNLNTTNQNLTSALGVVQDANIPSVTNQLTESEIQAQSGVAALKASTQLQQSYTSLLP